MLKPMDPASLAMIILGWCSLLYGVTEIINSLKIHSNRRKAEKVQEIPVAEEVKDENPMFSLNHPINVEETPVVQNPEQGNNQ